jgi:hypothetical protein
VEEVLPSLYEMVSDGVIEVHDTNGGQARAEDAEAGTETSP